MLPADLRDLIRKLHEEEPFRPNEPYCYGFERGRRLIGSHVTDLEICTGNLRPPLQTIYDSERKLVIVSTACSPEERRWQVGTAVGRHLARGSEGAEAIAIEFAAELFAPPREVRKRLRGSCLDPRAVVSLAKSLAIPVTAALLAIRRSGARG